MHCSKTIDVDSPEKAVDSLMDLTYREMVKNLDDVEVTLVIDEQGKEYVY